MLFVWGFVSPRVVAYTGGTSNEALGAEPGANSYLICNRSRTHDFAGTASYASVWHCGCVSDYSPSQCEASSEGVQENCLQVRFPRLNHFSPSDDLAMDREHRRSSLVLLPLTVIETAFTRRATSIVAPQGSKMTDVDLQRR